MGLSKRVHKPKQPISGMWRGTLLGRLMPRMLFLGPALGCRRSHRTRRLFLKQMFWCRNICNECVLLLAVGLYSQTYGLSSAAFQNLLPMTFTDTRIHASKFIWQNVVSHKELIGYCDTDSTRNLRRCPDDTIASLRSFTDLNK